MSIQKIIQNKKESKELDIYKEFKESQKPKLKQVVIHNGQSKNINKSFNIINEKEWEKYVYERYINKYYPKSDNKVKNVLFFLIAVTFGWLCWYVFSLAL